MKTKQWILAILAIIFATNVFAIETPKMNIIQLDENKALVAVTPGTPAIQELTISSDKGQVVYYRLSKKEESGLKKIFDLANLGDGSYSVKFKSGAATLKRDIEIEDGHVSVQPLQTELDPFFVFENNILKVSYLNFNQGEMAMAIYQGSCQVYQKSLGQDFTLQRGFDFSQLQKGTYDVSLACGDETYWFSVAK